MVEIPRSRTAVNCVRRLIEAARRGDFCGAGGVLDLLSRTNDPMEALRELHRNGDLAYDSAMPTERESHCRAHCRSGVCASGVSERGELIASEEAVRWFPCAKCRAPSGSGDYAELEP